MRGWGNLAVMGCGGIYDVRLRYQTIFFLISRYAAYALQLLASTNGTDGDILSRDIGYACCCISQEPSHGREACPSPSPRLSQSKALDHWAPLRGAPNQTRGRSEMRSAMPVRDVGTSRSSTAHTRGQACAGSSRRGAAGGSEARRRSPTASRVPV